MTTCTDYLSSKGKSKKNVQQEDDVSFLVIGCEGIQTNAKAVQYIKVNCALIEQVKMLINK